MLECDLVMKGGVTSGTVYPKAIVRLAKDYRFRSIGGTSAGAIAAAGAAAAEYRRQRSGGGDTAGFDELATLPDKLGAPGRKKKGATLLELFQPQPPFEALFGMLLAFIGTDRTKTGEAKQRGTLAKIASWMLIGRVCVNAMLHVPSYSLLGAAGSLVLAWLLGVSFALSWHLMWLAVFVFGGAAACALWGLWRALQKLPSNGFGLCRGFEPARSGGAEDDTHLTPWLHAMLQRTAGRDPGATPLTFGDLAAQGIELRVVTSNLCYGHPHALPFAAGDAWAFFREDEWARLFPKTVIEHLKAHPPARLQNPKDENDQQYVRAVERMKRSGLLPLPDADDLPVIVAVRLSLSFPILLSATPIHMLDPREHDSAAAQKCWFSDGGISSNFPLHFFDKLIPGRPTFAINLQEAEGVADRDRVGLPNTNHDGLAHSWKGITEDQGPTAALAGFLGAILELMQNWRDNSLLRLPGYRDRVAAVRLQPHEGGLNLNMPKELISALAGYGEQAADRLALHFLPQNAEQCRTAGIDTTWANHRWIRLLSTLAGLERLIGQLDVWNPATTDLVSSYSDLLDPDKTAQAPSYHHFRPEQRKLALQCLIKMRDDIAECRKMIQAAPMAENTPRPPMHFRLTTEF